MKYLWTTCVWGSMLLASAAPASAQAPTPMAPWTGAVSAGLAVTSGNTDTSTFNAAYDVTYDPKTSNVVKSDALLLRGKTQGVLSTDRFALNLRDQYKINGRAYVFGQNQYLRDTFKNIDYLLAPTAGIGYNVLGTMASKLDVDLGAGGVWEKNPGLDVTSSGAITAGEKLVQTITGTTTLTQSVSALWKTNDFGDSLVNAGVGVAMAVSSRTQFKIELQDSYKNKPPNAKTKKNDLATILALVFKL
jgi:putative salt-induced outer membrane protein YdiY